MKSQAGINMVDLMMWLVIAALLLAASIQGVGYYREAVIMYYLKSDALGAASNVKSTSAQSQGIIDQAIVDAGLENTRWSENTTRVGKSHTSSVYSITAGNPEVTRSVVYCSDNGITVLFNTQLAAFTCGGSSIAIPPLTGDGSGGGGTPGDGTGDPGDGSGGGGTPGDGSGDPGDGSDGTPDNGIPKFSGALAGWGNMNFGQLASGPITQETVYGPFHNKTVTNLQKANVGGCALVDGTLWCWNRAISSSSFSPTNMQLTGPLVGKTVTDISLGSGHGCVIADGDGYCWGTNSSGQLGDGTTTSKTWRTTAPTAVSKAGALAGKTLKQIKVGDAAGNHTCAIDTDNKLYCWGLNTSGQLGIGSTTVSRVPIAVNMSGSLAGVTVSTIAISNNGTCVLDTIGAAYCWGGREATATIGGTAYMNPVRTGNTGPLVGKSISQIHGVLYGMCVVSDGLHYCWGGGTYTSNMTATHNTPRLIMNGLPSGATVVKMSSIIVMMSNGKVYEWTSGDVFNQLGGSTVEPFASTPITESSETCVMYAGEPYCYSFGALKQVSDVLIVDKTRANTPLDISSNTILAGKVITDIDSDNSHTCGIADDTAYCWGTNSWGNLGDGTLDTARTPVLVAAPSGKAANIGTGADFSCATFDGAPYCWGRNNSGEHGNGTLSQSLVPVPVDTSGALAGKSIELLAVGYDSVCALSTDNGLYCWGDNAKGQFGNGTTTSSSVPIQVNDSGVLSGKDITYLNVGNSAACVVADGTAYCWGYNEEFFDATYVNVLTPKAMTSGSMSGKTAVTVQNSYNTGCILASDQTAHCWGANWYGELGNGTTTASYDPIQVGLTGVTMISTGSDAFHVCALSSTGLSCWGDNGGGMLGNGTYTKSFTPSAVNVGGFLAGKTVKYVEVAGAVTFAFYE